MDKSKRYQRSDASNADNNCACCNNGSNCGNCGELLRKIRAVDFSIQETVLYLDVYPHCADALEYYHQLLCLKHKLDKEYESTCGPLTKDGNESKAEWKWISSPWPWEHDANK